MPQKTAADPRVLALRTCSNFGMEPPAQAPALEEPVGFHALSDDLVQRAFLRAPFMTHGTLHVVCRRLKTLLRSPEFLQQRVENGLVEHGVVCAGGRRNGGGAVAECWMLCNGRWRPIPPMSEPRKHACSVIIDNEMWVMGGARGGGHDAGDDQCKMLATVEIYSPKTNSWRRRSRTPMSHRRSLAVAGVVSGCLVVAGGYCDGHRLSSAEAYTGTGWTPLPPMPHEAVDATACVLNGRLYVMGGYESNKLQVLEMTEENGLSWSCKADLPANRAAALSIAHEGKIVVMGGQLDNDVDTASVVVYDPAEDTWATAAPLPNPIVTSFLPQLNSNGEIVVTITSGPGFLARRDRHTSQWVAEAGLRINHAPSGEPGALLLG